MPGMSKQSSKYLSSKKGKKAGWRQQKLAINTVKKVAKEEAKKVLSKERNIFIKRNYLWHKYLHIENSFISITAENPWNNNGVLEKYEQIDYDGRAVLLSNIPAVDIEIIANDPQADEKQTGNVNENLDGDGIAQGMPTQSIMGRRTKNILKLQSLSATLRLRTLMNHADNDDSRGFVKVKYAFVLWRDEGMNVPIPQANPVRYPAPLPITLLSFRPFGYTSKIDHKIEGKQDTQKTRTLLSGETTLPRHNSRTTEKFVNIFKRFDNPITLKYAPDSQNGIRTVGDSWRLYFVCRSDVSRGSDGDHSDLYPRVQVCTKLNYYE